MPDNRFITNIEELIGSTKRFWEASEYWKAAIGTNPLYFICINLNDEYCFGLSKYCAFKNLDVKDYISEERNTTHGGITQKHICKVTGKEWTTYNKIRSEIKDSFEKWIHNLLPKYNLNKASFIILDEICVVKYKSKDMIVDNNISPSELEEKIKSQNEIGKVGELIALEYEIERLKSKGIKDPREYVQHVSTFKANAGFDIYSKYKGDERFIEVKSSLKYSDSFFITRNEIETLKTLNNKAYLYFVIIKDLKNCKGEVIEIRDPAESFGTIYSIEPILFRVIKRGITSK